MIRVTEWWLAQAPLDMRAGFDVVLTRVVTVFGQARPHVGYLFVNKRASRMKVLVHDGFGLWLASRRLHQGGFVCSAESATLQLTKDQFGALALGLHWRHANQAISMV